MNHFKHAGLNEDSDYKRDEIIRKIEHAVERMTLKELEALSYDMFTKGYFDNLVILTDKKPIYINGNSRRQENHFLYGRGV